MEIILATDCEKGASPFRLLYGVLVQVNRTADWHAVRPPSGAIPDHIAAGRYSGLCIVRSPW